MAGHRKFKNIQKKRGAGTSDAAVSGATHDLLVRDALTATSLSDLRGRRGLTQAKVAELLERSQAQISRIESATDPRISTIAEYVDALGARLDLIATFDDGSTAIVELKAAEGALMPDIPGGADTTAAREPTPAEAYGQGALAAYGVGYSESTRELVGEDELA